jgi:hypothetical protein
MDSTNIARIRARTIRYWYEDGLAELTAGAVFALIGAIYLATTKLDSRALVGVVLPVVIIGGARLGRRLTGRMKERVTYPHTGYVSYRQPPVSRRAFSVAIVAAAVLSLGALLSASSDATLWEPVLIGAVIACALLTTGAWLSLGRFVVVGLIAIALVAILAVAGLAAPFGTAVVFLGIGSALLISGTLALRTHLRRTQPPAEE